MKRLGFLALLVAGCSTVGTLTPISDIPGAVHYEGGAPVVVSARPHSAVAIGLMGATIDPNARITFRLYIENRGTDPITIGPENVSVVTDNSEFLRVITAVQLEREARRDAAMVQFAAALQAAGNSISAANAGYTNSYGNVSGGYQGYSQYGGAKSGTFQGSYSSSTFNSSAAAQAQMQANAENARIAQNAQATVANIMQNSQAGALQRQTIPPGQSYFTPFTIERMPPNADELIVQIILDDEVYISRWRYGSE